MVVLAFVGTILLRAVFSLVGALVLNVLEPYCGIPHADLSFLNWLVLGLMLSIISMFFYTKATASHD